MKNLILLRHAKSSWKDASIIDFERPLNKRGKRDAPLMAERFLKRNITLDLIISSSAKRTMDTANLFAKVIGFKPDIQKNDRLYEASGMEILKCINNIEDVYMNVLVVSHNPGLTTIVNYLSDFLVENIPTSGLAGFSIDKNWRDIREKSCSFLFFDYPKKVY